MRASARVKYEKCESFEKLTEQHAIKKKENHLSPSLLLLLCSRVSQRVSSSPAAPAYHFYLNTLYFLEARVLIEKKTTLARAFIIINIIIS